MNCVGVSLHSYYSKFVNLYNYILIDVVIFKQRYIIFYYTHILMWVL